VALNHREHSHINKDPVPGVDTGLPFQQENNVGESLRPEIFLLRGFPGQSSVSSACRGWSFSPTLPETGSPMPAPAPIAPIQTED
jgi:hypothetical protein